MFLCVARLDFRVKQKGIPSGKCTAQQQMHLSAANALLSGKRTVTIHDI